MKTAEKILIQRIEYGSELYKKSLDFRFRILREPLGMEWSEKDLDGEDKQIHIAAIRRNAVVGTVVLRPVSKEKVKLRQMAVDNHLQGSGVGKKLVKFAENFAKLEGYQVIEMLARVSAFGFYERFGYEAEGGKFLWESIECINMFKHL